MLTIKKVREMARESGKELIYNRSSGVYQIRHGFTSSEGELPYYDKNRKPWLDQEQLKKLASYI